MVFNINDDNLLVVLDDELSIYTVSELQGLLLENWRDGLNLEIDLSKVCEIDSAGVQWLMQVKREGRRAQRAVRYVNHSQPIINTLELLNLIGLFGDPVVLPAT